MPPRKKTGEVIYIRGENGKVKPHDLPLPEPIAARLAGGRIHQVNKDGSPVAAPATDQVMPAQSASKSDWVGYALRVDPELKPDDADAMTKADLIDRYGK